MKLCEIFPHDIYCIYVLEIVPVPVLEIVPEPISEWPTVPRRGLTSARDFHSFPVYCIEHTRMITIHILSTMGKFLLLKLVKLHALHPRQKSNPHASLFLHLHYASSTNPKNIYYCSFEPRLYCFSIISIDNIARFSEQVYCTVLLSCDPYRTHSPMGGYSFDWNT